MKSEIKIGLLGWGTVGDGVVKILNENQKEIKEKLGYGLVLKKVADIDLKRKRWSKLENVELTQDANLVIQDKEIDIIVEAIGGVGAAKDLVQEAIANKKHIVTSNKELIAKYNKILQKLAKENKVVVRFEASCGGGIPLIRPLRECLAGNKIEEIIGIVNGTTNYILTQMREEKRQFQDALKDAQRKGYAEADPANDIEGIDAMYKIAILAQVAWGVEVNISKIYHEGIIKITAGDIDYAEELGYAIKLLAIAKKEGDSLEIRVHPALIPWYHPLAQIRGVFNAILVRGDAVGEVMFYGQGAGSLPTASAVVGDIIEISKMCQGGEISKSLYHPSYRIKIKKMDEIMSKYYLRMQVMDKPGVLAAIASIFGKYQVSVASVVQKRSFGNKAEIVWVTHKVKEKNINQALTEIERLKVVKEICNRIRVEERNEE